MASSGAPAGDGQAVHTRDPRHLHSLAHSRGPGHAVAEALCSSVRVARRGLGVSRPPRRDCGKTHVPSAFGSPGGAAGEREREESGGNGASNQELFVSSTPWGDSEFPPLLGAVAQRAMRRHLGVAHARLHTWKRLASVSQQVSRSTHVRTELLAGKAPGLHVVWMVAGRLPYSAPRQRISAHEGRARRG